VLPMFDKVISDSVLDTEAFSQSIIARIISKMKGNTTCGPDGFPPTLFRKLKHVLASPLAIMPFCNCHSNTQRWLRE
jgi:hypothetical protein